jgi:hypothetical protein
MSTLDISQHIHMHVYNVYKSTYTYIYVYIVCTYTYACLHRKQILRLIHSTHAKLPPTYGYLDHVSYLASMQGSTSLGIPQEIRVRLMNLPDHVIATFHLLRGDTCYGAHTDAVRKCLVNGAAKQAAEELVIMRARSEALHFSDLARILLG